jgi:hypothetical protein
VSFLHNARHAHEGDACVAAMRVRAIVLVEVEVPLFAAGQRGNSGARVVLGVHDTFG